MKRLLTLILSSLLCLIVLNAQNRDFQKELYIGVNAGALSSRMDFNPSIPQTLNVGIHGGVSAKYISEKHLGVIAEINYSQRGWKEDFPEESGFAYSRTLNYVEVPFMTHIYFGRSTRFIINAGPQISFLLNDNQNMNTALAEDLEERRAANPDSRIGYQYSPFSEMKRVEYGLVGGIGMELQTGIGVFDIEGRYYFGLGDLFTSRRTDNAYFFRSAHRLIEAKLSYYIKVR